MLPLIQLNTWERSILQFFCIFAWPSYQKVCTELFLQTRPSVMLQYVIPLRPFSGRWQQSQPGVCSRLKDHLTVTLLSCCVLETFIMNHEKMFPEGMKIAVKCRSATKICNFFSVSVIQISLNIMCEKLLSGLMVVHVCHCAMDRKWVSAIHNCRSDTSCVCETRKLPLAAINMGELMIDDWCMLFLWFFSVGVGGAWGQHAPNDYIESCH